MIEETQSFLASIVEHSDDAIIGFTLDGSILSWNRGAERMYGYSFPEALDHSISMLALPERSDEFNHLQKRLRRGESIKHYQTMHLRKDGMVISVSLSVSPIHDIFGKIQGAAAISRDITQQMRSEQFLREAEEKYRLLFSTVSDAIILIDTMKGTIADYNKAAPKLYGYSDQEFSALRLEDLKADPQETFPPADVLPRHRKKDGTTFAAEISASTFLLKGRRMLVQTIRNRSERQRIDNLSRSMSMAKEVQQYLLPLAPPRINRLDIFAHSHYCQEIGGDYYDFFPSTGPQGENFGFAVGDVSGHGIGPALIMAMVRGILHAELEHHTPQMEELFTKLNISLNRGTEDSDFMTLFYGEIDKETLKLNWTSAGHGPVYRYHPQTDEIKELATTGIPLGIIEESSFIPQPPIRLSTGDILLIGTDGIWETRNSRGDLFDTRRLKQVLATWADKSARAIHDAILAKVVKFRGTEEQIDDMTLMVIKVLSG